MTMRKAHTLTAEFTYPLKLEELRDFVFALEGMPGNTKISFRYFKGDQRDPSSLTLSADLLSAPRPNMPDDAGGPR